MIVGGYTLDLYCDSGIRQPYADAMPGHPSHRTNAATFTGDSYRECASAARAKGWKLDRLLNRAICPQCSKQGARLYRT